MIFRYLGNPIPYILGLFLLTTLGCSIGKSARIPNDIVVKNNHNFKIYGIEVTAEQTTTEGTQAWKEELKTPKKTIGARYIGYTLRLDEKINPNGERIQVLRKGTYKSRHPRNFPVQFLPGVNVSYKDTPIKHCGQPGVACVMLESLAETEGFVVPAGKRETVNVKHKDSYQHYDEGSIAGILVDFPYEYLGDLIDKQTSFKAKLGYYRRGGYHQKVYDVCRFESRSCGRRAINDLNRHIEKLKGKHASEQRIEKLEKLLEFATDVYYGFIETDVIIKLAPESTDEKPVIEMEFIKIN